MGSVNTLLSSPAGLRHAGDLAFQGELPEADPAQIELAVVAAGPTATAAAVVVAGLEFQLSRGPLCPQPKLLIHL